MAEINRDHLPHDCRPIGDVLARVGDKWTILVIRLLSERRQRFSELHRGIGGISQRMLTQTLRGLERDGLVERTVYPTIPPRVEYELTERGRTLQEPLRAVAEWALLHQEGIEDARRRFDAAAEAAKAAS